MGLDERRQATGIEDRQPPPFQREFAEAAGILLGETGLRKAADTPPMAGWVSSKSRALLRLEAKSCQGLLGDMCALAARREQEPGLAVPKLTLHLHSGLSFTGYALRLAAVEDGHWVLVFHLPGPEHQSIGYDVMYLPLWSISAVVLHDAPCFAPEPEAPSRLELERRVARLEEQLGRHIGLPISLEASWQDLAEPPSLRHRLAHALDDLESIFEEMARDSLALAALRSQLKRVKIGAGAEADTRMKGDAFRIILAKGFENLDRASMKRSLEAGI